jgi:hypothetical protein
MSAIDVERIPTNWEDARDVPFFRIAALLFPSGFVAAAGALLAGFDRDVDPTDRLINLGDDIEVEVGRVLNNG